MNSKTILIVGMANLTALLIAVPFAVTHAEEAPATSVAVPDQNPNQEPLQRDQARRDQDQQRQQKLQQEREQRQADQDRRQQEHERRQQDQGQRQQDQGQRQQEVDQKRQQEVDQKRQQAEKRLQEAQQQLQKSAQEVAELSLSLNDRFGPDFMPGEGPRRVVLGVNIDMAPSAAVNLQGVRLVSVSPGGPADAAGLKANDLMVSFDGKPLQGDAQRPPQRELLKLLAHVKVGTSVAVEYRRDDKVVKTQVVPKSLPQPLDIPAPPDLEGLIDGRAFKFDWRGGASGLGSADLVELSPALGKYFGTDKGLLVVRAPRDGRLKLQDGDVILDIDGRVPTGVAHASQILGSYRAGESLKLHIMRQQKRVELPVEIPPAGEPATGLSLQELREPT